MAGLNFVSYKTQNDVSKFIDEFSPHQIKYWDETYYALTLPIGINFRFEEWLQLYGGLLNTFYLAHNTKGLAPDRNTEPYTYGVTAGVNLVFAKCLLIGVNYSRELSHFTTFYPRPDEHGYFDQISGRIGYFFLR